MSNPRWSNGHAKAGRIRNFERRAYLNGMSKASQRCPRFYLAAEWISAM
jgi:hypothetical protein